MHVYALNEKFYTHLCFLKVPHKLCQIPRWKYIKINAQETVYVQWIVNEKNTKKSIISQQVQGNTTFIG